MEHLSNDHKDRPNQQEKAIVEQILASKKRNPKEPDYDNHSLVSE